MDQLDFISIFENELTWKQHNELHNCINLCFANRTTSFKKNSSGKRQPIARVMCYDGEKLVGTAAYYEDLVYLDSKIVRIGGVGILCSLLPGKEIGNKCRKIIINEIAPKCGSEFCVSRVSEKTISSKSAKNLFYNFLSIPMIGTYSKSHDWEKVAIYKSNLDEAIIEKYCNELKLLGEFKLLSGEIF